jgi:hypothetical protein
MCADAIAMRVTLETFDELGERPGSPHRPDWLVHDLLQFLAAPQIRQQTGIRLMRSWSDSYNLIDPQQRVGGMKESDMRRVLTIAAALAFFGTAGTAFAQSGQGGYLGLNPGKGVGVNTTLAPPQHGSGQGGYLGLNPGADVTTARAQTAPTRGSRQDDYLRSNPSGK